MWKVFDRLTLLLAILSAALLIRNGFAPGGYVRPLQLALEWYEALMHALFGWAEPYLNDVLRHALGWTGRNLRLYPHWKHVFILMWLYIGADASSNWNFGAMVDGNRWRPRRPLAVSIAVFGSAVALASGTVAGTVNLHDPTSNTLMAAVAVVGFILYEVGFNALATSFLRDKNDSWWNIFRGHLRPVIELTVVGGVVLLLCTQVARIPYIRALPSPGLAILVLAVVALALYRIWVGVFWTFRHRELAERWSDAFHLSISGPLGLRMLKVIGGAAAFVFANAGLKLAGL